MFLTNYIFGLIFCCVVTKMRLFQLFEEKRANFAVKADYSKGSKIEKIVMGIIDSLEVKNKLEDFK